jgi:hypothetical protein
MSFPNVQIQERDPCTPPTHIDSMDHTSVIDLKETQVEKSKPMGTLPALFELLSLGSCDISPPTQQSGNSG